MVRSSFPAAMPGPLAVALFVSLLVPLAAPVEAQQFRPGLEAPGASGGVYALSVHDDGGGAALYAAGEFDAAGAAVATRVARWRLGAWTPLGSGIDGRVAVLHAFDEDGGGPGAARLFAGGQFTTAGTAQARNVARWNGTTWSALGLGTDDVVSALADFDDDGPGPRPRALYAGGSFLHADGLVASSIARWNGTGWEPLAAGLDGPVSALATFDPDGDGPQREQLIAGGFFERAGGVLVHRLARWDGLQWFPLGAGVGGSDSAPAVHALRSFDIDGNGPLLPRLIVGGSFSNAGGVPANGIAQWDGIGFAPLANGIAAPGSFPAVRALGVFDEGTGPRLYATGLLRSAGGAAAVPDAFDSRPLLVAARWDGATWTALGGGTSSNTNAVGRSLAFFDDDGAGGPSVFVGGFFSRAGSNGSLGVTRWSGSAWQALGAGNGLDADVHCFAGQDGGGPLFVGGDFVTAGSQIVNRVAVWNDVAAAWAPLGVGLDDTVRALHVHAGTLYAGGDFQKSAGLPVHGAARFTSGTWVELAGGTDGPVHAMASFQSFLAVGGDFRRAGGQTTGPLALWTGSSWQPFSGSPDGLVRALIAHDDGTGLALWAGGDFTRVGGQPASGVARWNGSSWSGAGSGLCCGSVNDLALHDDGSGVPSLYAAGNFDLQGDGRVDGVARWNPATQSWSAIGHGFSGGRATAVRSLTSWNAGVAPALVVGGDFATVDGILAGNVAQWRGGQWLPFGSGADDTVRALLSRPALPAGQALFVGGSFNVADGRPSARMARSN